MQNNSVKHFADRLATLLPQFIRLISRRQSNELYKGKITLPQFLVLEFLHREKEAIMSRIAGSMSVTTAATTGIVDRLVRDGYVSRENNVKDRRIVLIKLTSKGENLVDKVARQRRRMIMDTFGKLAEKERQAYLHILTKVYGILLQEQQG